MSGFDTRVHHYVRQGQQSILKDYTPHVKLKNPNNGHIVYVQKGKAWQPNGTAWKEIPDWVMKQIKQWTDEAKRTYGFPELCVKKPNIEDKPLEQRMKKALADGIISEEEYNHMFHVEPSDELSVQDDINDDDDEEDGDIEESYDNMSREDLVTLCQERDLKVKSKDNIPDLIARLEENDRSNIEPEVESETV